MELPDTPVKFSAEEIGELSNIRQSYEQATLALGQLEMRKRELKKTEAGISDSIVAVEAQEKAFLDRIVAKYGEGTFDINTGIFTPKK